jgi:predicted small metal-binding protein
VRKILNCDRLVPGCSWVGEAEAEEVLLERAAEHARQDHGLDQIDDAMLEKVRAAMQSRS